MFIIFSFQEGFIIVLVFLANVSADFSSGEIFDKNISKAKGVIHSKPVLVARVDYSYFDSFLLRSSVAIN
jgi:hypothetical protein